MIVYHELTGYFSRVCNDDVQSVLEFVEVRGIPYNSSSKINLFNFVTDAVITRPAAERIVSFYDHGKQEYLQFQTYCFIKRTTELSAPIKKACLPSFSLFKICTRDKGTAYQYL